MRKAALILPFLLTAVLLAGASSPCSKRIPSLGSYVIELVPDPEMEPMGDEIYFKEIKMFQGTELQWNKKEISDWISFVVPEGCPVAGRVAVRGGKEKSAPTCDVNGDGVPEVIIEGFSGGAHCCFTHYLISLGAKAEELLTLDTGNASLEFQDLNRDGIYEILTKDDVFAYWHTCFACSPFPPVVIEFQGRDWRLATKKYRAPFDKEMEEHEARLQKIRRGEILEDWDYFDFETGRIPVALAKVMLDRIYVGDGLCAAAVFREYPMNSWTRQQFRSDFLETLHRSFYWPYLKEMDPDLENLAAELR